MDIRVQTAYEMSEIKCKVCSFSQSGGIEEFVKLVKASRPMTNSLLMSGLHSIKPLHMEQQLLKLALASFCLFRKHDLETKE